MFFWKYCGRKRMEEMLIATEKYNFMEFPKFKPDCENGTFFKLLVTTEYGHRIVDGEWFGKADDFHFTPEQFYTLECGIDVIKNVIGFCEYSTLDVMTSDDKLLDEMGR
jgi:hypothetical protein